MRMGIEQNNTKYLAYSLAHRKSSKNIAYFIIVIVKSNEFDSIPAMNPKTKERIKNHSKISILSDWNKNDVNRI